MLLLKFTEYSIPPTESSPLAYSSLHFPIVAARLGFVASNPGLSCKHIRDAGDSIGDGEYWVAPENNRNPFKVYCDMTTDGGYFFIFMFLFMIFKLVHLLYLHQNDASISISKYVKV